MQSQNIIEHCNIEIYKAPLLPHWGFFVHRTVLKEALRICSYPMVVNLIEHLVMINDSKTNGRHLIFRPYIVRNGKVIYPKNGRVFAFWVDD